MVSETEEKPSEQESLVLVVSDSQPVERRAEEKEPALMATNTSKFSRILFSEKENKNRRHLIHSGSGPGL